MWPLAILHLRQDLAEHERRIGHRAAERSRMEVALRAAQIDLEVRQPAQAVADRRDAAVEHRRVRDHHDVGRELLLVRAHELVEVRAAHFLFALDEELDVDRQAPVLLDVRLDGLDVHEHLALVVGGAARVDLAVAHRRLERRGGPQVQRVHRLHVVVAVEEDGRLAGRVEPVAVHHRIARRLDQLHVLEAGGAARVGGPLGAAANVGGVLGQRRNAGNREVLLELVNVPIAIDVDEIDYLIHAPMICHASPSRRARPSRSSFTRCASTPCFAIGSIFSERAA